MLKTKMQKWENFRLTEISLYEIQPTCTDSCWVKSSCWTTSVLRKLFVWEFPAVPCRPLQDSRRQSILVPWDDHRYALNVHWHRKVVCKKRDSSCCVFFSLSLTSSLSDSPVPSCSAFSTAPAANLCVNLLPWLSMLASDIGLNL